MIGGYCYQQWGLAAVLAVSAVVCASWLMVSLGMQHPRYLTSLCFPEKCAVDERALVGSVRGVVEAYWAPEQSLLYLKVDKQQFERASLDQYLQQRSSRA